MPAGALAGLCPACLLAQGVETETPDTKARGRFEPPKLAEISHLFPQLEVLELLGAGGMGAVYKARQPALDRLVALKVLPAGGGVGSTERFNREARALARLSHPNIVAVHEFGQVEGLHFFIMEFVDGATLRQLERTSRFSPREALQIIPQICDALQYAHDEGVVHRDIKPENVLIDRKGRVKIADFGLAKIAVPDPAAARLTAEGQVMGTPHYMAPEQVERPLTVDHRADIYALGVVFYEMLTGELPLGKFAPPSRKVQVDVRLDEIVLRALENDPERRYQQASEVKVRVANLAGDPPPGTAGGAEQAPEQPVEAGGPPDRQQTCAGWLGVALRVEHAGRRRIRWSGVWALFGISLGLLTLLSAFVPAAGLGTMGNVFGWAGFGARMVLAAGIVGLGIWRARRVGAPVERVSHTAVLLPSSRRNWRRVGTGTHWALWVLAWLCFQTYWLTPWLKERAGATVPVARLNPLTQTLAVTLTNGATIELLALADGDAAPNQWWRPDGTPLTNTVFDIQGPAGMLGNDRVRTKFAFKVTGAPWVMETANYEFEPSAGSSAGGEVWRNGERIAGGWPLVAAWAYVTNHATLRLGMHIEPWRAIATFATDGSGHTETRTLAGDPAWIARLNHFSDDGTDTRATVVLNRQPRNWRMRLVAVDREGREHAYSQSSNTPAENHETWTCTFSQLTVDRIQHFQVQVQPVYWIEFRKVPLSPNGTLPSAERLPMRVGNQPAGAASSPIREAHLGEVPEVPDLSYGLTFRPVREIAFDEPLDLDTGRTGSLPINPPGATEGNPLAGTDSNIAWMGCRSGVLTLMRAEAPSDWWGCVWFN